MSSSSTSSSSSTLPTINPHIDYYALLGISSDADTNDIKKAYRRKALELHPDKNPDNPKADELFHMIKQASDLLLDINSRKQIDQYIQAKAAVKARHAAMTDKRNQLRQQLETREKEAKEKKLQQQQSSTLSQSSSSSSIPTNIYKDTKQTTEELRRLQAEGAALAKTYAEERYRKLQQQQQQKQSEQKYLKETNTSSSSDNQESSLDLYNAIRIRWNDTVQAQLGEDTSTISNERLQHIFKLYGNIVTIIGKKSHTACIVFSTREAAEAAIAVPPDGMEITYVIDDDTDEENINDTNTIRLTKRKLTTNDSHTEYSTTPSVSISSTSLSSSSQISQYSSPMFPSSKTMNGTNNPEIITLQMVQEKEKEILPLMHNKSKVIKI